MVHIHRTSAAQDERQRVIGAPECFNVRLTTRHEASKWVLTNRPSGGVTSKNISERASQS